MTTRAKRRGISKLPRTPNDLPPIERVRELLKYDPDTGELRWRVKRPRALPNQIAGSLNKVTGYISVGIDGDVYLVHRVGWALYHGTWPAGYLSHKNGDTSDNRIANLLAHF